MTRAARKCVGGVELNEHLRERLIRKLEALNDERGYQVLDYVEFLESKFAERSNPQGNAFTRFTEAVEDKLRAGRVSASAISETMGLLNKAANVLSGAVAAGKSVAEDIVSVAQSATPRTTGQAPAAPTTPPAKAAPPPAPPATDAK
ncbi:MAG TPA: hypothetical protein VF483_06765 [Gemmatimonadaceae bacterium]